MRRPRPAGPPRARPTGVGGPTHGRVSSRGLLWGGIQEEFPDLLQQLALTALNNSRGGGHREHGVRGHRGGRTRRRPGPGERPRCGEASGTSVCVHSLQGNGEYSDPALPCAPMAPNIRSSRSPVDERRTRRFISLTGRIPPCTGAGERESADRTLRRAPLPLPSPERPIPLRGVRRRWRWTARPPRTWPGGRSGRRVRGARGRGWSSVGRRWPRAGGRGRSPRR